MIKKHLIFLLAFGVHILYAQNKTCDCVDELENTAELIKNAKSYQYEIVQKNRTAEFEQWKEEIQQEIAKDSLIDFFCVGYLQKYISFISDQHNQIYFVPEKIAENVPTYSKAIDTDFTSNDPISGIYYAGSEQILVKKESDNVWYGIMLQSDADEWSKGKIRLRINKTANGNFELFEYFQNGLLFYHKNIDISDGRIHSTFWNKENNYFFNQNHESNFTYQSINPSFDYIGIKTLSRTTQLMKEAEHFYKQYLDQLTKENVIVDLRNNGGGSENQAKALLKALKKNKAIQHIYVLMNFKTASAAELIALELKKDKRTVLAGENSRGMLTYGYGNRSFSAKTNCFNFQVSLSTKRENKKLSQYESIGIKPDVQLDNKSDWVDQIVNTETLKNF